MKIVNFLIVIACMLLVSCNGGNSPSDAAKKIVGYLQSQDYEKLVAAMVEDETATVEEKKQQKAMVVALMKEKVAKELEAKQGIKDFEILEEKIAEDGQTATVKVKYIYGNAETKEEIMNFKKVGSDWKIYVKK